MADSKPFIGSFVYLQTVFGSSKSGNLFKNRAKEGFAMVAACCLISKLGSRLFMTLAGPRAAEDLDKKDKRKNPHFLVW